MTLRTVPCEPIAEEHCECFGNHNTACCWCKWNPTDDEFIIREQAGEDPGRCSGVAVSPTGRSVQVHVNGEKVWP